jgi:hypothetical protein
MKILSQCGASPIGRGARFPNGMVGVRVPRALSMSSPRLGHYRRPHRILRRLDPAHVQHGKEPSLLASLYRGRPSVSARSPRGVAFEVEDVHHALPYRRTRIRLFDWHGLSKRGRAAVLGFDSPLKLVHAAHWNRHA